MPIFVLIGPPSLSPVVVNLIRRVGEILAIVVAETLAQARDAAEHVDIEYTPIEAVVDGLSALSDGLSVL
ncbi:MAG: hypothetical protein HOB79_14720 [Rhodospirillaceae bacterium]|nr:hypothetical protein [Rhodospirillales bacterium]MBT3904873.1 hypothetical protein [Rhodospirillaceae bacterium]MBT4702321.1 hypothetical protein [Rhodospirillaceae bacterium]MBT5034467.1 hypothetical protein [Rhodospirillaceae bacterium]MBT6220111.1 hypothetical protein [Rhodospirillaceae bacterium]